MGRKRHEILKCKTLHTLDLNDFGDYPSIVFDICSELDLELQEKYDKIICLAILEHVYNPFKAVENLHCS